MIIIMQSVGVYFLNALYIFLPRKPSSGGEAAKRPPAVPVNAVSYNNQATLLFRIPLLST